MGAIIPVEANICGSSKASALSLRAIEKASASSALSRDNHDAEQNRQKPEPVRQVEPVYRDDTPRFDPFWDGPRLVPAFVVQLLGQTMSESMPERRESVAIETAYGRAISPRKALLLDRKS